VASSCGCWAGWSMAAVVVMLADAAPHTVADAIAALSLLTTAALQSLDSPALPAGTVFGPTICLCCCFCARATVGPAGGCAPLLAAPADVVVLAAVAQAFSVLLTVSSGWGATWAPGSPQHSRPSLAASSCWLAAGWQLTNHVGLQAVQHTVTEQQLKRLVYRCMSAWVIGRWCTCIC
jgi:hypothetical protein